MAAYGSGLTQSMTLDALLEKREIVQAWVAAQPCLAALIFVAVYAVTVSLAIPATLILSLFSGFLFGRWLGTALVLIGASLGALIVFLAARSAFGGPLRGRAGPFAERLDRGLRDNAVEMMLFLRLVPVFPFFLVNLVAVLFAVPLRVFLLTTVIGIAPAVFIYNSVGRQLGTMTRLDGLLSPGALMTLLSLAALSLLPIAVRRWKPANIVQPRSRPDD